MHSLIQGKLGTPPPDVPKMVPPPKSAAKSVPPPAGKSEEYVPSTVPPPKKSGPVIIPLEKEEPKVIPLENEKERKKREKEERKQSSKSKVISLIVRLLLDYCQAVLVWTGAVQSRYYSTQINIRFYKTRYYEFLMPCFLLSNPAQVAEMDTSIPLQIPRRSLPDQNDESKIEIDLSKAGIVVDAETGRATPPTDKVRAENLSLTGHVSDRTSLGPSCTSSSCCSTRSHCSHSSRNSHSSHTSTLKL